jgi:iron complex outermembrane receptor protein
MISRIALASALIYAAPALAQTTPSRSVPPPAQPDTVARSQAGPLAPAESIQTPAAGQDSNQPTNQPRPSNAIVVTGHFLSSGAKSAMKMDVSVMDTPFSVSSYSNAFQKSIETTQLTDLYNYMTGVKKSGNTAYDITIRGFKSSGDDRNAIMVDGLPGLTSRYASPPTVNLDHIELVKGAMSVLYGQIQPGGFVNMVTKKPQRTPVTTIELRGDTYASKYRNIFDHNGLVGDFDSTGPLTANGRLTYRLIGELVDRHPFRDFDFDKQRFISPSMMADLGSTQITAQFEYRHVRQHFDVGLAAPPSDDGTKYDINLVAPPTTTYQQPTDFRVETGTAENLFLVHHFGGSWRFNGSYRHVNYSSDQKETSTTGLTQVQGQWRIQRRFRDLATRRHYDYADLNFTGTAKALGIDNKLLVGINFGSDMVNENRRKFFNSNNRNAATGVCPVGGTCLDIALYNPDYSGYPVFDSVPAINPTLKNQDILLTNKFVRDHNYGIYVSDLATITPWLKISLAGRNFSETAAVEADARHAPGIIDKETAKKNFLPSAGVLIEPTHHLTIYGSFSESFVPVDPSIIDLNGGHSFNPIEGKQYEVGIKTQNLLGGRLAGTLAWYRIDQVGQITQADCVYGTCGVQLGKGRTQGVELEGNFTPIKNWQVIFGFAHINAKVLSADPDKQFQIGRTLPNVAPNAANIWTRYDWANGLGVGLGVTYTGRREGVLPTVATDLKTLDLPAYTVADGAIYWERGRYSLTLKIGNIFDRRYYASSGGGSLGKYQVIPGEPRNIGLAARVKF